MEPGYPQMSDSFLAGQDVLYTQFNNVFFYVEDEDQENFYYVILKKIFAKFKFIKIFPLNGKTNVKAEAAENVDDHSKVFIVDKDFDDILNKVEELDNLFYLDRYSIENYLLESVALKRYVVEEKPKLKVDYIENCFNFENLLEDAYNLFKELTCIHLVVQKFSLGIENIAQSPDRFCIYTPICTVKEDQMLAYKNQVNTALKLLDSTNDINIEIQNNMPFFVEGTSPIDSLKNIPGKYLLKFAKNRLEHIFSIASRNIDSFMFRLASNCSLNTLEFLKRDIEAYLEVE